MAKRRSNQPPVPPVASATCHALLAAADAFGSLEPWTWMHDSELVGLRYPATGQEYLCSILGRLRTVFALLVYRPDAGHRWVLNTIGGDRSGFEDPDSAFEQDCVKVEFTAKGELTKPDRAVVKEAGFTPTLKRGPIWPAFRSLVPGGFPWYPTEAEAALLLWALPRARAFALLCRDNPTVGDGHQLGEVPFLPLDFDPTQRPLRPEDLDWHPMIPPPEPAPEAVSLDEATIAHLLQLEPAKGFLLEVDLFYAPMAIADAARPYFPKSAMAVDRASGFIGGYQLAAADSLGVAACLGAVLASAMKQPGCRPAAFCVQRPRVGLMLAAVAERLRIPIRLEAELPALDAAREAIERRFVR